MIALVLAAAVATAGATLDRAGFKYERAVPSAKGLVALQLDADVLARADQSLRDVRIVNGKSEQVPYILESRPEPLVVPIAVPARRKTEGATSVYELMLPFESLPRNTVLVLTTNTPVFAREVSLRVPADEQRGREPMIRISADWRGTDPRVTPPPLTFDASYCSGRKLELLVDEGDNAPLTIAKIELHLPAFEIRFYHPGTPLTLLYGNPNGVLPRYDLALLEKQIATEKAQVLILRSRPRRTGAATFAPASSRMWFWAALVVVVAALLALLARLISAR